MPSLVYFKRVGLICLKNRSVVLRTEHSVLSSGKALDWVDLLIGYKQTIKHYQYCVLIMRFVQLKIIIQNFLFNYKNQHPFLYNLIIKHFFPIQFWDRISYFLLSFSVGGL